MEWTTRPSLPVGHPVDAPGRYSRVVGDPVRPAGASKCRSKVERRTGGRRGERADRPPGRSRRRRPRHAVRPHRRRSCRGGRLRDVRAHPDRARSRRTGRAAPGFADPGHTAARPAARRLRCSLRGQLPAARRPALRDHARPCRGPRRRPGGLLPGLAQLGRGRFVGRSHRWVRRVAVRSTMRSWRRTVARLAPGRRRGALVDGGEPRTRAALTALGRLPDAERRAVVLVDMAGVPVVEVAALEQVPPGTVAARLSRARRVVGDALADRRAGHAGVDRPLRTTPAAGERGVRRNRADAPTRDY